MRNKADLWVIWQLRSISRALTPFLLAQTRQNPYAQCRNGNFESS